MGPLAKSCRDRVCLTTPKRKERGLVLGLVRLAGVVLLLPSCTSDFHVNLLGYTSRPNYDTSIRTVYVPIFKNQSFRRGLEFDLTRAVIREIQAKTPYRVVSNES